MILIAGIYKLRIVITYRLDAILQNPKNSPFPGSNPLPLAQVMYLPASKTLGTHGAQPDFLRKSKRHQPKQFWSTQN